MDDLSLFSGTQSNSLNAAGLSSNRYNPGWDGNQQASHQNYFGGAGGNSYYFNNQMSEFSQYTGHSFDFQSSINGGLTMSRHSGDANFSEMEVSSMGTGDHGYKPVAQRNFALGGGGRGAHKPHRKNNYQQGRAPAGTSGHNHHANGSHRGHAGLSHLSDRDMRIYKYY